MTPLGDATVLPSLPPPRSRAAMLWRQALAQFGGYTWLLILLTILTLLMVYPLAKLLIAGFQITRAGHVESSLFWYRMILDPSGPF